MKSRYGTWGLAILLSLGWALAGAAPTTTTRPASRPGTMLEKQPLLRPGGPVRPTTRIAPTSKPATVSPEAQAVLEQVKAAYGKLKSLELAGTITLELDLAGQKQRQQESFDAAFLAPNLFRHQTRGNVQMGSTGQKVYLLAVEANEYILKDAPTGRISSEAQLPPAMASMLALAAPPSNWSSDPALLLAISSDAAAALKSGASDITLASDVSIDGKPHMALVVTSATLGTSTRLLLDRQTCMLRQSVTNLKPLLEKLRAPAVKTGTLTIDYTAIKIDTDLKVEQFAWTAPAEARQLGGASKMDAEEEEDHHDDHDQAHGPADKGKP